MSFGQHSYGVPRLQHLSQHSVKESADAAPIEVLRTELKAQYTRVQELMHLNVDAGVVYIASPALGVMTTPQPAIATFLHASVHAAVRAHFTVDGYTLIQAAQSDASEVQLAAPIGPHVHYYPLAWSRWKWHVLQCLQLDLHQLWSMYGSVMNPISQQSQLELRRAFSPEQTNPNTKVQTGLRSGRFQIDYSLPMSDAERECVLAQFAEQRRAVIQVWRDILTGADVESHSFQNARRDALEFRGPPCGNQCRVHASNRAFEQDKRERLTRGDVAPDDPSFMVHCSIERDEDCDCETLAADALVDL